MRQALARFGTQLGTQLRPRFGAPLRTVLLLGALLALTASCDGTAAKPRRIDRVIDLLARMSSATGSPGLPDARHRAAPVDPEDRRDRLAFVSIPAGQWIEWHDLRAGADAALVFGCGVGFSRQGVGDAPVTFTAEAWPTGTDRAGARRLQLTRSPWELAASETGEAVRLDLGAAEQRWSIRFAVTDDGSGAGWPAIVEPRLLSAGRVAGREDQRLLLSQVETDLLAELPRAEILEEVEELPLTRALLDTGLHSGDASRTCLRAAAPSRVRYRVTPGEQSRLAFAVGVDEATGWASGGAGMLFAVDVDGERIYERPVRPPSAPAERAWSAEELDLSVFAGREVALDLVTETLGDARGDVGGWAAPMLLHTRSQRRLAAHQAPTVLVLLADTLRADRCGPRDGVSLTPRLDAEAARGVQFTAARTVTSWTWPTIGSLFTGLYPGEHGVNSESGFFLVAAHETLAERLQGQGYSTAAFVANPLIGEAGGFDQGFETFAQLPFARARALNDRVLNWFDATEGLARAAYVHYFDPHLPYEPLAEFAPVSAGEPSDAELAAQIAAAVPGAPVDRALVERFMARQRLRYDAEVRALDAAIGELLDALEARGALDNALIVFASDHGEEFYEHGLTGHGWHLYDESLRIPLFVSGRGPVAPAPRIVERPVEIRAVLPTLVELLGLPRTDRARLSASLLEEAAPDPLFGQTGLGLQHGVAGTTLKLYVLHDEWKLISTPAAGRYELYDLRSDPTEHDDRFAREPRRAELLGAALDDWAARTRPADPSERILPDPEAQRELLMLGYVGR